MANAIYPKAKEAMLRGNVNLVSDNVKVVLVDLDDYTYSASHEFLNSVASAARVATSAALSNKSVTDGVFDADDVTFTAVTGDQSEAFILFVDTGVESTSRLIAFFDTVSSGLLVTPNGGDITLIFDNGPSKIFAL